MKPSIQTFEFPTEFSYPENIINDGIEEKQRTEQWHEDRRGKFTGSKTYQLMTCTSSTKNLNWDNELKIVDLGETAKKYIYSRAKERQRKIVLKRSIGQNGAYGTEAEKRIIELIKIKHPSYVIEDVGFIEFLPGIAGASPDGLITTDGFINKKIGLEMKAATNWEGLYNRIEIPFTPKQQDFWQINSEMLSLKCEELLYVIAEPPEDLKNPEIINIKEKLIEASKIHQNAIIKRCLIGNGIVEHFLSGRNFSDAVTLGVEEYLRGE
jgi:hypothetical protein